MAQSIARERKEDQAHARTAAGLNQVARRILRRTRRDDFHSYLSELLLELCRVDTTPGPEIQRMRRAEDRCFRIIERELGTLRFSGMRIERRAVNPAIQSHPNYSLLHFTKTRRRPEGLSPEAVYARRSNLVGVIPGRGNGAGRSVALNAHIDVVAPYFPPTMRKGIICGRGACDDKGPLVGIVGALKVLSEVMAECGLSWNRTVVPMFVVEEETGGNGSLSLAVDRDLKKHYESMLVCECTGLNIHPANRGAVWYRATLRPPRGISALEMFAFVNEEMEKEGAAIRAESRHRLFPQRPVQTCHGIIGPFGEHPSRICGDVAFAIRPGRRLSGEGLQLVQDCMESGLAGYVAAYGDKTKVADPATGKPMVSRHYEVRQKGGALMVRVRGATGHMGAIRERDGAITKMAYLVRSLVYSRAKLEAAAGSRLGLELPGAPKADSLVLEGGQGFVPTHDISEIMTRMRKAAERGAEAYLRLCGRGRSGAEVVTVTYAKLHNVAFDGAPDSLSMRNAITAAQQCGIWEDKPVLGWTVSCDARLFATEYPGMEVLTFGPGQLTFAHSDHEQMDLAELRQAVEFLALFLLKQTGTCS